MVSSGCFHDNSGIFPQSKNLIRQPFHADRIVRDIDWSFEMEKYMKRVNPEFAYTPGRILELNAEHPVFQVMEAAVTADPEKAKDYAKLLYGQALLMADLPLEDPMAYSELVCKLMK